MSDTLTFADGIGGVGYVANTLRIEFVRFDPSQKQEDGSPVRQPCHTLILTEGGFLELLNALQQTHQRLVELRHKGPAPPLTGGSSPQTPPAAVSPNFPEN